MRTREWLRSTRVSERHDHESLMCRRSAIGLFVTEWPPASRSFSSPMPEEMHQSPATTPFELAKAASEALIFFAYTKSCSFPQGPVALQAGFMLDTSQMIVGQVNVQTRLSPFPGQELSSSQHPQSIRRLQQLDWLLKMTRLLGVKRLHLYAMSCHVVLNCTPFHRTIEVIKGLSTQAAAAAAERGQSLRSVQHTLSKGTKGKANPCTDR